MATIPVYITTTVLNRRTQVPTVCRQKVRGIPFRICGSRLHYAVTQLLEGWIVTCVENGMGFAFRATKNQARKAAKSIWGMIPDFASLPVFKRGRIIWNKATK